MFKVKNNKVTLKNISFFCQKITKKRINEKDDLFKILDSLELMVLLTSIEKKFKIQLNMVKILSKKKLYLLDIKNLLN